MSKGGRQRRLLTLRRWRMAYDQFSEIETADLVVELKTLQLQLLQQRSQLIEASAGDGSFRYTPEGMSLMARVAEIKQILSQRDPVTYPPADNIQPTRTTPVFT